MTTPGLKDGEKIPSRTTSNDIVARKGRVLKAYVYCVVIFVLKNMPRFSSFRLK